MAGYVVVLVAFPVHLNLWTAPRGDLDYHYVNFFETLRYTMTGTLPDYLTFDAISRASPLDAVKSGLSTMHTFAEISANPMMGSFGGRGWEWISYLIGIGGIWLLLKKIIRWHIPLGVFTGLLVPSILAYIIEAGNHASPGFYLFSGGTMLCAFFVATDPVSAATSTKGRFVYGVGIGFLIYAIRRWGSYADGVAFAVILMNMAVPAIDYLTKPRIVGHIKTRESTGRMNESAKQRDPAPTIMQSGLILAAVAAICTTLVALTFSLTKDRIAANEQAYLEQSLTPVLAGKTFDNDLSASAFTVRTPHDLPGRENAVIYRARAGTTPVVALFVVTAPDGFTGPISC